MYSHGIYGLGPTSIFKPIWFTNYFLTLTNVRHVSIDIKDSTFDCRDYCSKFISEFPYCLEGFRNLRSLQVWLPMNDFRVSRKRREKMITNLNKRIFTKIGVQGVLKDTNQDLNSQLWTWEAEKGQIMDWSKTVGWQWNLPHRPRKNKVRFLSVCHRLYMKDGCFLVKDYECERHDHSKCPLAFLDWNSDHLVEDDNDYGDAGSDDNRE